MKSFRRITKTLFFTSVFGLVVGFGPAVFMCGEVSTCTASLSIYQDGVPDLYTTQTELAGSSNLALVGDFSGPIATLFEVIQVTSIYLLLLTSIVLVALEAMELRYLRTLVGRRHKH